MNELVIDAAGILWNFQYVFVLYINIFFYIYTYIFMFGVVLHCLNKI